MDRTRYPRKDSLSFAKPKLIPVIERLSEKKVSNIRFNGKYFSCTFDGRKLRNLVLILPHYEYVGGWARKKHTIYIDDDMLRSDNKKELISLMIHESVEKYASQKYGLREDTEGHLIADKVEYLWAKSQHINWDAYSLLVDMIRKKENRTTYESKPVETEVRYGK